MPLSLLLVLPLAVNPGISQVAVMATNADDPMVWLFNLGTAGVWLVCYMTGLIHSKAEVDYLKSQVTDAQKKLEAREQLLDTVRERLANHTIPMLGQAAVQAVTEEAPRAEQFSRIEDMLNRIERGMGDEQQP